jgi:hypothetical protein
LKVLHRPQTFPAFLLQAMLPTHATAKQSQQPEWVAARLLMLKNSLPNKNNFTLYHSLL